MPTYQLSGLTIESELDLPGVAAVSAPPVAGSYTLRVCQAPRREPEAEAPWLSISASERGYLLRFREYADFWVDVGAHDIRCDRLPHCTPDVVEHLLLDRVIPHLVLLGGRPSFHASAVVQGERVLAFMGRSGAGKSTLAASFGADCAIASDDTLALSFEGDRVTVHPNSPSVRLHPDSAAEVLGAGAQPIECAGKLQARMRGPNGASLTLERVYFLEPADAPPELVPVGRRDAIASLAHHLYRLDAHDPARLENELATLELLATRVRCARLRYRHCFQDLALVRRLVIDDRAG